MVRPGNLVRLIRNRILGVREIPVPTALTVNHRPLLTGESLVQSLKTHYFKRGFEEMNTEAERYDWNDHLSGRMLKARDCIVPWVASVTGLRGKRMLEIGCGTGSSTVAFAEQGVAITAIDIDEPSLNVARHRLAAFELQAELLHQATIPEREFDIVLMYAVLEHMTLDERLEALSLTWPLIADGGHLVVVETPNRLWYHDDHTSLTDFYLWLPDDIALRYVSRTPRPKFKDIADPMELVRWGRGVSYQDFELAFDIDAKHLPIVSSYTDWERRVRRTGRLGRNTLERRYERILREIHPELPFGFEHSYLDVIFHKRDSVA